jgi:hypothetical protein
VVAELLILLLLLLMLVLEDDNSLLVGSSEEDELGADNDDVESALESKPVKELVEDRSLMLFGTEDELVPNDDDSEMLVSVTALVAEALPTSATVLEVAVSQEDTADNEDEASVGMLLDDELGTMEDASIEKSELEVIPSLEALISWDVVEDANDPLADDDGIDVVADGI